MHGSPIEEVDFSHRLLIEDSQRSIKQIRERIEHYEKRNVEIVSKWPNGIPEWARNEKYNTDTKISELKWTIYDD